MIIRAKRKTNYTIISNVGLEDERLSLKAKGILAYLLSKPDDWRVSDRHLATIGPDGRAAVQAALKELEACGYLARRRVHGEDGKWAYLSYIYDEPWLEKPATEKPATEKPATEKPATENQAIISTEVTSTEVVSTEPPKTEKAAAAAAAEDPVFVMWTDNMPGTLTPHLVDQLQELRTEYSDREIVAAIGIAVERNKRNLGYVRGVLARGVYPDKPPDPAGQTTGPRSFAQQSMDAGEEYRRRKEGSKNGYDKPVADAFRLLPQDARDGGDVRGVRGGVG